MRTQTPPIRRFATWLVATAHIVAVAAALLVPLWAAAAAFRAHIAASDGATLGELINARRWLLLFENTLAVTSIAALVATLFGITLGFLAGRTNMPGRTLLIGLVALGACIPFYVSLVFIFAVFPIWQLAESRIVCGILYGLVCTPLATLILGATFRLVDPGLEDQARLDAGEWRVFLHVTLRLALVGIAATATIVTLIVATDFTISNILLVRTYADEVYTQFALARSQAGPTLASLPYVALVGGLLLLFRRYYRPSKDDGGWQIATTPRRVDLRKWRWLATLGWFGGLAALTVPPVKSLIDKIETTANLTNAAYELRFEIGHSALSAVAGATLMLLLAPILAWALLHLRRWRWTLIAATIVLLATPASIVGVGLIQICNRPGVLGDFYDSPAIIVAGFVVRFLPYALLLFVPALARVPSDLPQAARVDGCDWLGVQRHVYIPAILPTAPTVWLILLLLCFGEIGSTVLVAPPGWEMASVRAFTLLHFGVYHDLAVLAVLSTACIIVPWLALVWLVRRRVQ